MNEIVIRPTVPADLPTISGIVGATGLFPPELLEEMAASSLGGRNEERWLSADAGHGPLGFAYVVPEKMTEGTWNLLAIGVDPGHQSIGIGAALLRRVEHDLGVNGNRVLLVDTSGAPEFARSRAFYCANGYDEEARIRDYWAAGDDKVTYWKALG